MVQNIQIGDAPFYFPLGTVWKLFDTIGAGFIRLFMEKKFNYSVFFHGMLFYTAIMNVVYCFTEFFFPVLFSFSDCGL